MVQYVEQQDQHILARFELPSVHSVATVFYCNNFEQFWTTRNNANLLDMRTELCAMENAWLTLNFIPTYESGTQ